MADMKIFFDVSVICVTSLFVFEVVELENDSSFI